MSSEWPVRQQQRLNLQKTALEEIRFFGNNTDGLDEESQVYSILSNLILCHLFGGFGPREISVPEFSVNPHILVNKFFHERILTKYKNFSKSQEERKALLGLLAEELVGMSIEQSRQDLVNLEMRESKKRLAQSRP